MGLVGKPLAKEFERTSRDVAGTQRQVLDRLLASCRDTEFGRDHRFADIRSVEDYRSAVPIRDFEGHRPYVQKMMNGAADVLFPGRPLIYNTTSGTSAAPKMIPISAEYLNTEHQRISRLWLYSCLRDNPGLFSGKCFSAIGPAEEGVVEDGTPYGSISGVIYRTVPSVLKDVHSAPYPIYCIEDYDKKYYGMMRFGLWDDVSYIIAANPSSLLQFHKVVTESFDDLVEDIRRGTLREDVKAALPPGGWEEVQAQLVPDPERADALFALRQQHGEGLRPRHYWPNLRCINTWKQGNCRQILPKLDGYFPPETALREFGYQASEARAGLALGNDWDYSALAAHVYFFEFIEESERDSDAPEVLLAHQLELGKRYYVSITNATGLYRYDINDIIEVKGFHNQLPLFEFVRKGDGFTSLTGEKLTETQVIQAVERTGEQLGAGVENFCLCCDEERLTYTMYLELAAGTSPGTFDEFAPAFDAVLQEINPEYEAKRGSKRLAAPGFTQLPAGSYELVKNALIERGMAREGQYKVVYLQRKPKILEVYAELTAQP
jgi:hypothetical protein